MLNIITLLYRKNIDWLYQQYNSIPKEDDVHWIISKTDDYGELPDFFYNQKNIKIISVDYPDTLEYAHHKIYAAFDNVKEGYFIRLDDDTLFHNGAYQTYKNLTNNKFVGVFVGQQLYYNDNQRLSAHYPAPAYIDSGNVMCHTSILNHVKWTTDYQELCPDGNFYKKCADFFGEKNVCVVNTPISYYNYFINQTEG